jgi:hypothetical protein
MLMEELETDSWLFGKDKVSTISQSMELPRTATTLKILKVYGPIFTLHTAEQLRELLLSPNSATETQRDSNLIT